MAKIGIIGGSGLYDITGLSDVRSVQLATPFGQPSGEFVSGNLDGWQVIFLPRHGKGHKLLPSEINYRANIYGMKKLGVERIISVSAVGSLKEEIKPGDFVLADQFVDRTNQGRKATFFGEGIVAHIAFAAPVCPQLSKILFATARQNGLRIHPRGTYVNIEGPAFSTRAESYLYKSWDMDIIGMTNMAEARLAREAELCYATLAMVTDYDCWHTEEETVSADLILQNMRNLVHDAKRLIKAVVSKIPEGRKCLCAQALKNAMVTSPKEITPELKQKLEIIIGKYI